MENLIKYYENKYIRKNLPKLRIGDTISVNHKITEGSRKRIQEFAGIIIAIHNNGLSSSFTVRKLSHGEGVEKIFPLHSPLITSIIIKKHNKVRLAKLYYLRKLSGKASRLKQRFI